VAPTLPMRPGQHKGWRAPPIDAVVNRLLFVPPGAMFYIWKTQTGRVPPWEW